MKKKTKNKQNKTVYWTPQGQVNNAMPFGIKRMNIKHRMDCSYYNY